MNKVKVIQRAAHTFLSLGKAPGPLTCCGKLRQNLACMRATRSEEWI